MRKGIDWTMIASDHPEWERMWDALGDQVDREYEDPATGERWQYMGSSRRQGLPWGHEFRHRRYHGQRSVIRIPASDSFGTSKVRELRGLMGRRG